MTNQQATTRGATRAQMDALVEGHYRAEESGNLEAIVEGFTRDAAHDATTQRGRRS